MLYTFIIPNSLLKYIKFDLIFIFQPINFFETLVKVEESKGYMEEMRSFYEEKKTKTKSE